MKKNYIFGVFDGHGGNHTLIKAPKFPPLSRDISRKNFKSIAITRRETTRPHSDRPSSRWTTSSETLPARTKSPPSRKK